MSLIHYLTHDIGLIVPRAIEEGRISRILGDRFADGKTLRWNLHLYQKLFDYMEEGREEMKRRKTNPYKWEQPEFLWHAHQQLVNTGLVMLDSHTIETAKNLRHKTIFMTPKQYEESYFLPAKQAWLDPEHIKPDDKLEIMLMKHFNRVTNFIASTIEPGETSEDQYRCTGSRLAERRLLFDSDKDRWVYEPIFHI